MFEDNKKKIEALYDNRFSYEEIKKKEKIWKILCKHFFQKYIHPNDVVIDIGTGFCEFINNIECKKKIGLDINPATKSFANSDVEIINESADDITSVSSDTIDVAFVSNFFEHLPSKEILSKSLEEIHRILKTGGKVCILQPNIAVLNGKYWDFYDHNIPLSHKSMAEALLLSGFRITEIKAKFLPYTTKSRLPSTPFLVRLYLLCPIFHNILGGQAWLVAEKLDQKEDEKTRF